MSTPADPPSSAESVLEQTRVMAILRADDGSRLLDVSRTLLDAGIRCLEITSTTPGAVDTIRELAGQDGVAVGMGTALRREHLERTVDAGGSFVVSPHTDPELVRQARRHGLDAFPGALTPTEIVTAVDAGATAVKLFPASTVGPDYLRAVRAPLPTVRVVATGGVDIDSVPAWLDAGAWAVAVSGPLVRDALRGGSLPDLAARARRFLRAAA